MSLTTQNWRYNTDNREVNEQARTIVQNIIKDPTTSSEEIKLLQIVLDLLKSQGSKAKPTEMKWAERPRIPIHNKAIQKKTRTKKEIQLAITSLSALVKNKKKTLDARQISDLKGKEDYFSKKIANLNSYKPKEAEKKRKEISDKLSTVRYMLLRKNENKFLCQIIEHAMQTLQNELLQKDQDELQSCLKDFQNMSAT